MGKVNSKICEKCGKKYRYKQELSPHREQCQKLKSYSFSACQKTFTRKDSLQVNVQRIIKK